MDEKDREIQQLKQIIELQQNRIDTLCRRVEELELALDKASKNSSNSSKSPSSDIVKSPPKKPGKPGQRKKRTHGAQKGHQRKLRQPFASSRTAPQQSLAELTAAPLDLYSVSASELLSETDQALIDTLRVLVDAPAGTRRLEFDEYLQMLGPDAIAFAANCQKETGVDICGLSNDPACIAVFLGVFRMVEQGRLDRTLAAGQLQQSLILIDQNWLRQIN